MIIPRVFSFSIFSLLLSTFAFLLSPSAFAQGSLTPPGAPAPTMKTLDQIRSTGTAINATNTPGDANYHFVLNAAGSYFLTGNLGVTKTNGIHVTSAGVTVYLNGFQINRGSGTGGTGILIDGTAYRCVVENGGISGFATGITSAPSGAYARGGVFKQLLVTACTTVAIDAGDSWQLDGCTVQDNTGIALRYHNGARVSNCTIATNTTTTASVNIVSGGTGGLFQNCVIEDNHASSSGGLVLQVGSGSSIIGCNIASNSGNSCVQVGGGSSVINTSIYGFTTSVNQAAYALQLIGSGCSVLNSNISASSTTADGPAGTAAAGIYIAVGNCTIKDCTVVSNLGVGIYSLASCAIIHCTLNSNQSGTIVTDNSTVTGCTANSNTLVGIQYHSGCLISENAVCNNTDGLVGRGVNNRVDNNQAYGNHDYGIVQSASDADFTIRNISNQNGDSYSPTISGPYFGPYSTPGTATSPWANF